MLSWILRKNEFYALKNAPAFVFWKNPGGHNLLLRFTDLELAIVTYAVLQAILKRSPIEPRFVLPWKLM